MARRSPTPRTGRQIATHKLNCRSVRFPAERLAPKMPLIETSAQHGAIKLEGTRRAWIGERSFAIQAGNVQCGEGGPGLKVCRSLNVVLDVASTVQNELGRGAAASYNDP